jgi:hypothetical protein
VRRKKKRDKNRRTRKRAEGNKINKKEERKGTDFVNIKTHEKRGMSETKATKEEKREDKSARHTENEQLTA